MIRLLSLGMLLLGSPSAQEPHTLDAATLEKIADLAFLPGTMARRPDPDYSALRTAIESFLPQWKRAKDPWVRVASDRDPAGSGSVLALDVLTGAITFAAVAAPSPEEAAKCWRLKWDVLLRALRDPATQETYQRDVLAGKSTPDATAINILIHQWLPGARDQLVSGSPESPPPWGVLAGAEWHDAPGAVIRKGTATYIDPLVLRSCFDLRLGQGSVQVGGAGRLATIRLRSLPVFPSPTPRKGGSRRNVVAVTDLQRHRLCEATVSEDLRAVIVRPIIQSVGGR